MTTEIPLLSLFAGTVEEHAAEVITDLILFGLRKKPEPSEMEHVKDRIEQYKNEICFLQENLGTDSFKDFGINEEIKRYTHDIDSNLDRLTELEIERRERLNSVAVFPQTYVEIIIDARKAAMDFYYNLEVSK